MTGNVWEWYKAAQVLGILESQWGKAWPDNFNAYDLAKLQEPENEHTQNAIRKAIADSLQGEEIERKPTDRDIGRIMRTKAKPDGEEISRNMILAAGMYPNSPELNGGNIIETAYRSGAPIDWLRQQGLEPSEHIQAWHKATRLESNPCNVWLNREHLTLDELLLLSMEEDPNDKDLSFFESIELNDDEAYIKRRIEAEGWIRAGLLQGRRVNNGGSIEYRQINPVSFFTLAKSKEWDLAQEIIDFLHSRLNMGTEAVGGDGVDTKESQLHALIWRARQQVYSTGKGSAQKVWHEIQRRHEKYDFDEIIQEVTATEVLWRSAYGNESKFKRSSLDSLLSRLKKSPPF